MLTSVILEQNVLQKWNILFCGLYYSAGFKPDIEWNEYDLTQNPTDALLPLGDPDEFMLGKAISLITGVKRSARGMNTLSKSIMRGESVYQSTERHATGGMLMVPEGKDN